MVQTKKYAIGKYNPDGSRKTKRQRIILRPYMTEKRKQAKANRENKLVAIAMLLWIISSSLIALADTTNTFVVETRGPEKTITITDVTPASAPLQVEEVKAKPVAVGSVEQQVRAIATEKDFRWTDYLVRLANCESRLNPKAINTANRDGSIDWGLFQWNSENPPMPMTKDCAMDLRCSTEKTIEAINQGMQDHWVCNDIVLKK